MHICTFKNKEYSHGQTWLYYKKRVNNQICKHWSKQIIKYNNIKWYIQKQTVNQTKYEENVMVLKYKTDSLYIYIINAKGKAMLKKCL